MCDTLTGSGSQPLVNGLRNRILPLVEDRSQDFHTCSLELLDGEQDRRPARTARFQHQHDAVRQGAKTALIELGPRTLPDASKLLLQSTDRWA
jgi:hypothetical protein